jgi:hypothetical protein
MVNTPRRKGCACCITAKVQAFESRQKIPRARTVHALIRSSQSKGASFGGL